MRPILFEIPYLRFGVSSYGFMILLACAGALAITAWRAKRENLDPNQVYEMAVWLFLGGILGARALYVIQYFGSIPRIWDLFQSWQGGNVFYGCIIGGLVGTMIYWWRHPFPFLPMADAVAPGLAVGVTLGRLGCFLHGCCYGAPCHLPWAVRYGRDSHAWAGQVEQGILPIAAEMTHYVHPTQLYASLSGLLILIGLSWYFPRRRRDGEVMALLMMAYALTRWPIELLRGDDWSTFAGMTLSQNVSLGLFILGLALWINLKRSPALRHADQTTTSAASRFNNENGQAPRWRFLARLTRARS